jgi:hypothetical protein
MPVGVTTPSAEAWARRGVPDVLVVGTDPILSVLVALGVKKCWPQVRVVHWCFDLHPEGAIAEGGRRIAISDFGHSACCNRRGRSPSGRRRCCNPRGRSARRATGYYQLLHINR